MLSPCKILLEYKIRQLYKNKLIIFCAFYVFRVLEIVQNEDYLTAADTSIIRRKNVEDIQDDFGSNKKIQN